MKIKNRERLCSVGNTAGRRVVLEVMEAALENLDSYGVIRNLVGLHEHILRIGEREWPLGKSRRLYVVGAGKACNSMARALEDVLGDRITEGLVIVKQREPEDQLKQIQLAVGGHPIPNEEGSLASKRILDLVGQATPEDLFIGIISGGSSALMNFPVAGITLEEEIRVTEELLKSGARIQEVNAVRRHISETNGGRLVQKIEARGAESVNLIISDMVGRSPTANPGRPVDFWGTPVGPDNTTLQEARSVLKKYQLHPRIPRSVIEFLESNNPSRETPKAFGHLVHHFVLQNPADACEVAQNIADRLGLKSLILTTFLEGESREAGTFLACVAKEVLLNNRPLSPPCVLIAGGETTTRVETSSGLGGPSQELVLGFALEIGDLTGITMAAIDTDGTDGPTEVAGGIADGITLRRCRMQGLDLYERLMAHDSSHVLKSLGDEIITGNTGTNLCDLNVVYITR